MAHGTDRLNERLTDAGFSDKGRAAVSLIAHRLAPPNCDSAIAFPLGTQVGTPWGNKSNGDVLFVVIRGGKMTTAMLRRSTQTNDATALRVDRVMLVPPNIVRSAEGM